MNRSRTLSNNHPLISVIIPTYNRARLLERTIESVLSQSFCQYEIIIVDDASTDNTEKTVEKFPLCTIQYIKNEINYGATISRNIGINHARGKYVSFLDSDDLWNPEKLEKQYERCKNLPISNWLCCTQVKMVGLESPKFSPSRAIKENEPISDYLFFEHQFILTSTFFLLTETAKAYYFTPHLNVFQDSDFVLRMFKNRADLIYIDEPLCEWNCDRRKDRITMNHTGFERLKWFLDNLSLFAEKSTSIFVKKYVLPKITSITMKKKTLSIFLEYMNDRNINIDVRMNLLKQIVSSQ